VEISLVRSGVQADEVRTLAWEFVDWLRSRYPEDLATIDEYLFNQKFAEQLANLLEHFTPPDGECLLAGVDGASAGIVMLKPAGPGTCEMNRMFVRPEARRRGVGRALCLRLMERARELGYRTMVLSALDQHHEALPLYHALGFHEDARASDTEAGKDHEVQMKIEL